jgi:arylsulfatase A-like enzyme
MNPNILILISDQLRRSSLGCYGHPDVCTPNLDRLAKEGVRFDCACSTYPVCVPFRFTLMTGEYAHTRNIPAIEWSISPAERTIADDLNEVGYETIYVGKWHLDGGHGRMGSARQVGLTPVKKRHKGRWQKWFGFELRNDPFDTYYFIDDDPEPVKIDAYQTDGLYDIGMDYLRQRDRSRPFCMTISVEPPHPKYIAPEKYEKRWAEIELNLPQNFHAVDTEQSRQFIGDYRHYHAMVENLDFNVGRIYDFLKKEDFYDKTVIIFVSDHGDLCGSHGLMNKQWPYEESVGIPLIIHDPQAATTAGKVLNDPVCTEDLYTTILGFAGLEPKTQKCGKDLSKLVKGEIDRLEREAVLLEMVSEHRENLPFFCETWRGVRSKNFKYTVKGDKFGAKPWQFFDLANDPFEMKNVIDDPAYKNGVIKHHKLLVNELVKTEDFFVLAPAWGQDGLNLWDRPL